MRLILFLLTLLCSPFYFCLPCCVPHFIFAYPALRSTPYARTSVHIFAQDYLVFRSNINKCDFGQKVPEEDRLITRTLICIAKDFKESRLIDGLGFDSGRSSAACLLQLATLIKGETLETFNINKGNLV